MEPIARGEPRGLPLARIGVGLLLLGVTLVILRPFLIPAVLVPSAPGDPAPKVTWTFRVDSLVVGVDRAGDRDILIWEKGESGFVLREVK